MTPGPGGSSPAASEDYSAVAKGWSIKEDLLGKEVYNDNNESIGTIEDLLVTREKAISYAIVGVGGFLGIGRHDVAVPVSSMTMTDARVTLPGATEESLKEMPAFEYEKPYAS